MKKNSVPQNSTDGSVVFRRGDAQRINNAVLAYERSPRARNPSKLPRAVGGAGGGEIRLAQFSGQWRNEAPNNIKIIQLFMQRPEPIAGQLSVSPFDWIPDPDGGDTVAINWLAHVPSTPGDTIRWCVVTRISDLSGQYNTGSFTVNPNNPGQQVPLMQPYSGLWLLIAAEC